MKSGAHWFYWIAALSFITSIIVLTGNNWGFLVSLGVTQFVDAVATAAAPRAGNSVKITALVFDVIAAGLFALIGYFASKRYSWVFIVGMALYALDALILVLVMESPWLGLAFHAFALYSMFSGYRACARLAEMDREAALAGVAPDAPRPAAESAQ